MHTGLSGRAGGKFAIDITLSNYWGKGPVASNTTLTALLIHDKYQSWNCDICVILSR